MAAVTQHRPSDALAGRRYGSFAGKPAFSGSTHPVDVLTQHRPDAAIGGKRYGSFAGRAGVSIPTITSVTAVSGTELAVAWTGTATEYRLNGGTATALPDGTSPDTISGLTDNTYYLVELRDGAGAWSTGVGEWTDNTGGGGGSLAVTLDATGGSGTLSAAASITSNAALAATGGSGTLSAIATGTAYITMAATGGSGTLSATAYTPATASLAATGGSGTLRAVASGVTSDEDLRGSPPGLNCDADEDEYIEDMQMLMAIAAAAFELEMV